MPLAMKFIVKRREYLGKVPRAFGADVPTYTAWSTVQACSDIGVAQEVIRHAPTSGTWVYGIFHKGRRLGDKVL